MNLADITAPGALGNGCMDRISLCTAPAVSCSRQRVHCTAPTCDLGAGIFYTMSGIVNIAYSAFSMFMQYG